MRRSLAGLVLVAILGANLGLQVPYVQAQASVMESGPVAKATWLDTVFSKITSVSTTLSASAQKTLGIKEFTLDGIAFAVAQQVLKQIQKATVNWINSGFEGSPAFVQDLGGFLQDNADKLAGKFIYGSDLKALCSPFALNIRIALSVKYLRKDPPVRCTLSGVVGNIEGFLAGNFASGGWPGWFEMTVNPNNNFFGASAAAESALLGRLAAKERVDVNKLLFGKGFLGQEKCDEVDDPAARAQATEFGDDAAGTTGASDAKKYTKKINCKTVTPGDTIANALTFEINKGQQSLLNADEINEVISALFAQLALKAFTSVQGIAGLNNRGVDYGTGAGNSTVSYLDQMNNQKYDTLPGQSVLGNDLILTAIEDEGEYRDLYAGVVGKADAILARIKDLEALVANEDDDVIWECSSMDGVRARTTAIRTPAFAKQSVSDQNLAMLDGLQRRFATATQNAPYSATANEERLRAVEEFAALQARGALHDDIDIEESRVLVEGMQFADTPMGMNITGVPKPINAQLAELAAELEGLCHSRPKERSDGGSGGGD